MWSMFLHCRKNRIRRICLLLGYGKRAVRFLFFISKSPQHFSSNPHVSHVVNIFLAIPQQREYAEKQLEDIKSLALVGEGTEDSLPSKPFFPPKKGKFAVKLRNARRGLADRLAVTQAQVGVQFNHFPEAKNQSAVRVSCRRHLVHADCLTADYHSGGPLCLLREEPFQSRTVNCLHSGDPLASPK